MKNPIKNHRILLQERDGDLGETILELFLEYDGQIFCNNKGIIETTGHINIKEEKKYLLGRMFIELGKSLQHLK